MTPTEMETVLQNLDARLLRIEQILPTLATKGDLRDAIGTSETALRGEIKKSETTLRSEIAKSEASLREEIERSSNQTRVLIEAVRSDNQLLAEHVLEILTRLRNDR